MALSLMRTSPPFTKMDLHGIKRRSPCGPTQWPPAKHQRLCSPTPPCEESLPSIHSHTTSKPDLPTPPDSLSGKDELEAEASCGLPSARRSSNLDPAQTLLLTPIEFTPASYLSLEHEMAVLRKRPHVATLGGVHMRRRRTVLEIPYARIPPRDKNVKDPIGFNNPRNWCYRRALTQSLMNLSRFGDYLLDYRRKRLCAAVAPHPTPCLLEELAELYEACSKHNVKDVDEGIRQFDLALRRLATTVNAYLANRSQEDAHVLFTFIINDQLRARFNHPPQVLQGLFYVGMMTRGQCRACGNWGTPNITDDLGLTVAVNPDDKKIPTTLDYLLDEHFSDVVRDDIDCADGCGLDANGKPRKSPRRYYHSMTTAPEILVIQLGRFGFTMSGGATKNNRHVGIPTTLDMSRFLNEPTLQGPDNLLYRLNSTVCHSGTLRYGHYICYASKNAGKPMRNRVYRFDDQVVTPVNDSCLADPPYSYGHGEWTPYILFYECIKTPASDMTVKNTQNESIYRPSLPPLTM